MFVNIKQTLKTTTMKTLVKNPTSQQSIIMIVLVHQRIQLYGCCVSCNKKEFLS